MKRQQEILEQKLIQTFLGSLRSKWWPKVMEFRCSGSKLISMFLKRKPSKFVAEFWPTSVSNALEKHLKSGVWSCQETSTSKDQKWSLMWNKNWEINLTHLCFFYLELSKVSTIRWLWPRCTLWFTWSILDYPHSRDFWNAFWTRFSNFSKMHLTLTANS